MVWPEALARCWDLIAGYKRGWLDSILIMIMDVIWAFPAVLLAIVFITMAGNNLRNAMIAIAIVTMPTFMRVVRGRRSPCER